MTLRLKLLGDGFMRKIFASVMIMVTLLSFSACSYRVKNEGKAEKVYTCSSDNMFGLEKAVVFKDGIVLVFDKKANDSSEHADFENVKKDPELYGSPVQLHDINHKKPHVRSSFIEKRGKYIASAFYYGDEDTKDIVINGMTIYGKVVDIDSGDIKLSYEDWEGYADAYGVITQRLDASTGEWGEVETDIISTWSEG